MQCSATRMGSSFTLLFACLFAAPCIGPESAAMAGPAAGYPVPAIARHWRRPVVHRVSLLDGTEELAHPVSQLKVIRWTAALHRPRSQDTARLHLWLGDYELSAKGRPTLAIWHFRQAQRLSRPSSPVYGAAAYDSAVALYSEGAYRDAMAGFDRLLTHPMPGYDWKDCALWYRHAAACVGYHAERAAMGIPEPRKLDPLAGAAALSTCLRSLGLPWSKSVVMAACPEAGESLEFSDMQQAAKKLGADLRPVMANDQGLMALPKPAVAMVERDHWVSVIRADRRGVAYLCSDCGPYPGGEVDLSWSQWHALNPAYYLCVTRMRSKDQRWISRVLNHRHSPVRIASRGSLSGLLAIGHALQLLKGAVIEHACSYPPAPGTRCAPSLECVKCLQPCPGDSPGSPPRPGPQHGPHLGPNHSGNGKSGPSGVDPVNLASGEEEYGPAVDLDVYNPTGPSVEWSRIYNSLRNNYSTYGFSNDFGGGWSTGYNVGVYDPTGGGTGNKYLVEPNDARVQFYAPMTPNGYYQHVTCTVSAGFPALIVWNYNGTTAGYYTITFANRSKWTTLNPVNASTFTSLGVCPVGRITDRSGNYINLNYDASSTHLTSITDSAGTALLTVTRDSNGYITAVSDRYSRSIYYQASGPYYPELSIASQVVTTGTVNPPARYTYGYEAVSSDYFAGLMLHTITVPSPTGTGNSTATINYETTHGWVTGLIDGNGNVRSYVVLDPNHASVSVVDSQGHGVYSYSAGWDLNMSETTRTDGAGTILSKSVYGDPRDPYCPSSVTDAIGAALNPAVPQNSSGSFAPTGTDSPVAPLWDIVRTINGTLTTIATSAVPNGWTANFSSSAVFTVAAPAGATVATNYEVRFNGDPAPVASAYFDVTVPGAARQGTSYATWDQYGNCLTSTSPRGTVTTYTYSYTNFALGELTQVQEGTKSPTTFIYAEPSGLQQSFSRPLPGTVGSQQTATTSFTYNSLSNVLTLTAPGNNSAGSVVATDNYTTDGQYTQAAAADEPLTETDNLGRVWHFRYDSRGNPSQETDPRGNITYYDFNLADQMTRITYPPTGQTGTGSATTAYTYLYPGGPLTSVTQYDESALQVRQVNRTYGLEGELLTVTGSTEPVTYSYDGAYRTISLADGNSHSTGFSYNSAGYLNTITYPGGQTVTISTYNANGAPLKRIDGNNVETDYVYNDVESKLTDVQYPATTTLNIHIGYDSYGRRASMTDSTGSAAWTYDDGGDVLTAQTTYTGLAAQTIGYGYYPDGSRQTMTTPAGNFTYGYDAEGLPNNLTNPYNETSSWTYLENRWLSTQQLGNGATTTWTYNARGFPTDLQTRTNANVLLSDFGGTGGLLYDSVGNLGSEVCNVPASSAATGTNSFQYNSQDEMTQEQSGRNGGYTETFGYDAAFNPTTFRGAARTFNSNNQNNAFTFDGNGNPSTYNGNTLGFDPENRLTSYGSVLTAGYNGDGLRAWKQGAGGRTYFLYDGTEPVCELNSAGTVTAVNTFGCQGLVSRHTAAGSVFYTFDPEGSVNQRLDSNQAVLSTSVYDAFGNRLTADTGEPWGFCARHGYFTDSETGLQLLCHRYYDPGQGRFLTRDPKGYAGGVGLYCYGRNGAPNATDPTGLDVKRITCGPFPGSGLYFHAYLKFDHCGTCKYAGFYDYYHQGLSVVFNPEWWGDGLYGVVSFEKPNYNDDDCDVDILATDDDMAFQNAICDCVKQSHAWPHNFSLGYVCGSWITDMRNCGWAKAHPDELIGNEPD